MKYDVTDMEVNRTDGVKNINRFNREMPKPFLQITEAKEIYYKNKCDDILMNLNNL